MTLLFDVVLPLLVIYIMMVLGTELIVEDFKRVRHYPLLVPCIVVGQWIIAAVVAGCLGKLLRLPHAIAGGALLVAAAPVAALSNYYTQLARGHLALAITLTAFSNVLAIVATPLLAAVGFRLFLGEAAAFDLPIMQVAKQTVVGLLLPLLVGMTIRRYAPAWVRHWRIGLERIGMLAMAAVFAFVVIHQFAAIRDQFGQLLGTSLLLTLSLLGIGLGVSNMVSRSAVVRRTVMWGFPGRNLAVAALIASTVLGQVAMVSFAAVLFATHLAVLIPLALWLGRRSDAASTAH